MSSLYTMLIAQQVYTMAHQKKNTTILAQEKYLYQYTELSLPFFKFSQLSMVMMNE